MPKRKPVPDLNAQEVVFLIVDLQSLAQVRAVFVGQEVEGPVGSAAPEDRLSSKAADELRVDLGLRISTALVDGRVAGAVAQSNLLDYRAKNAGEVCVGPPVGSVEVWVKGEEEAMGGPTPAGKVSFPFCW